MLTGARWRAGIGWAGLAAVGVAMGALPIYLAAGLVGGAGVVLLALVRPELGLGILAFSVPFGVVREFTVAGFPLTATELLTGLMLLVWVAVVAVRRRLRVGPLLWPIALFIGVLLVSLTATTNKIVAIKEVLRWAELLAAYLITVSVVGELRARRQLLAVILISGAAVALVGWAQFFGRIGPESFRIGPFLRAYGTFGQPNPYGGYLGMVLPLAMALALLWRRPRARQEATPVAPAPFRWLPEVSETQLHRLAYVAAGVIGMAMLMSMSRGAWMGAFAALSLIMIARGRRTALVLAAVVLLGVLILAAGVFNMLPAAIGQRVSTAISYFGIFDVRYVTVTLENWPVVERMAQWQVAWEMFQDHYYLGVGPGSFPIMYADYALKDWPKALGHAHNIYLNMAAEVGLAGLLTYLVMVGSWLWVAGRRALQWQRTAPGSEVWALAVGCLAVLLAASIHNGFDNLYVHGMNVQIGLTLGLTALRGDDGTDGRS
ncbi:MAG: O-antigen ligase family protein [Bacteroidetes bacterium]|nr:O-antigen ligase family protein [Bacteroidota bacterium]MCL5026293.1 O-antigen ligase family protein [Chloroflexota bacterium]